MANYQIKSGDCLWNIVKANYNCNSNKEISEMVNTIAKENNIKNSNLIQAGANLVLPHNDKAKFEDDKKTKNNEDCGDTFNSSDNSKNNIDVNKLAELEKWTSSEENALKFEKNENVEDFEMFDFDVSTYSSDLKDFSQAWIDKYDTDKDGELNFNEFISWSTDGENDGYSISAGNAIYNIHKQATETNIIQNYDKDGDNQLNFEEFANATKINLDNLNDKELAEFKETFNIYNSDNIEGNENNVISADEILLQTTPDINGISTAQLKFESDQYNMFQQQFNTFSFDENKETINAGELASILYTADLNSNPEEYKNIENIAPLIDGKIDYERYQTFATVDINSQDYKDLYNERLDFYNNFYTE